MQFIYDKGLYKIARITGPKHNLLAIRLSETVNRTEIVSLPIKSDEQVRIDKRDVLNQVKSGLNLVNKELGKNYFISEIQFVPSDSRSSNIYELLTKELIKRIYNQGEFVRPVRQ